MGGWCFIGTGLGTLVPPTVCAATDIAPVRTASQSEDAAKHSDLFNILFLLSKGIALDLNEATAEIGAQFVPSKKSFELVRDMHLKSK
jgi:hypothetical protein